MTRPFGNRYSISGFPSTGPGIETGTTVQQDYDFIGKWFELREKTFGIRSEYMMGRVRESGSEPEWYRIEHRHFDGVGAFLTILEREGMVIDGFPSLKETNMPGRMAQAWIRFRSALLTSRLDRKYRTSRWKVFHENAGDGPNGTAWFIFSREETSHMRRIVREKKVSMSAFLLWTLGRSIPRELLLDPDTTSLWRLPVNLRGPYLLRNVRLNHVGSLFVEVQADLSLEALHRKIQGMMKRNMHLTGILRLQAAKQKGLMKKETMERSRGFGNAALTGRYTTGTFTNLGVWPAPYAHWRDGDVDDTCAWLVTTPLSGSGRPIGAGSVCWNGRISLTVDFAAGLVPSAHETRRLASLWLREILGCLGQATGGRGSGDPEGRVFYNDRSILLAGRRLLPESST